MSKQIIYCGWDSPPAAPITGVPQQQPASRGIDSFVRQAVRGPNHKQLLNLASPEPWTHQDFANYEPGTGLLWARLLGGSMPMQRWWNVCQHIQRLSNFAQARGYDGILLDIESYKNTVPIFQCPVGMNFQQAKDRTFQMGVDFAMSMDASVTLTFHRLLSHLVDLVPPVGGGDKQTPPALHMYGLLPSFIAGLLSVKDTTLIDFCGTNLPREPDEVFEQFAAVRSILPGICDIDYSRVKLGQSMYLDQFIGPKKLDFYGMLQAHYRCTEAGVLLYAESGRLCLPNPSIHAPPVPYPLWPDVIPGFSDSLCRVADPAGFARDFTASHPSILVGWRFGQRPGSALVPSSDESTITGKGGGWLFQEILHVKPGESFAFSCNTTGNNVWMGGRWHAGWEPGRPTIWIEDRRSSRKFYPDEQGRCSGTIVAPPGAETLLVTMAVEHVAASDSTTFIEPKVCRI